MLMKQAELLFTLADQCAYVNKKASIKSVHHNLQKTWIKPLESHGFIFDLFIDILKFLVSRFSKEEQNQSDFIKNKLFWKKALWVD